MLDDATLREAAATLDRLRHAGLKIVTAESCTGGLIAASLTHHAGASDVVQGGFVTYSNALKGEVLGVKDTTLAQSGAVSEKTAGEMALGALHACPAATLAVAVTGIAGPDGGGPGKPVGLVCFGVATGRHDVETSHRIFPGDRAAIRAATVKHAFKLIARVTSRAV